MITIPATALYDVLKEGKANFFDREQYRSYELSVSDEPRFDSIESEDDEHGRFTLKLSKSDFMSLMLDRYLKFEYSFIKLEL